MSSAFYQQLADQLAETKAEGLYKKERIISSDQSSKLRLMTARYSTSAPTTT